MKCCKIATPTLAEWLEWWLQEQDLQSRAQSTIYGYRNIVCRHLIPAMGHVPLQDLQPMILQNYLHAKLREGLSPNTVRKHYTLLHAALKRAAAVGVMENNPMNGVYPPQLQEIQHCFYSPEQLRTLFLAVEGTSLELTVKLAAYLGLRRSEIAGLRWCAVDRAQQTIVIQEVRTEVGADVVLKQPKTRTSVRKLSFAAAPDLQRCLEIAWKRRRSDDPAEFVLQNPDGSLPTPNEMTLSMAHIIKVYDLPKITLHGLRHSFASIANQQGVSMYDISRVLGHSSISVTSSIYTHLFDETQCKPIGVVASAILPGGALGEKYSPEPEDDQAVNF